MRPTRTVRSAVFLTPLLALPLLVGCQPAEQEPAGETAALDTAAVRAAIDTLRQDYLEAYNGGDAATLATLYTADAVFHPADAPPVEGRESIGAYFGRFLAPGPSLEVESHEVIPLSESWASSGGGYRVTVTPEGAEEPMTVRGSYLLLFRNTAEGWKLFRHTASYDSVPPAPEGSASAG